MVTKEAVVTKPTNSGTVESLLDFRYLFRAFRLTITPGIWILALLSLVIIYTAGRGVDLLWGPQVLPGEISAFHNPVRGAYREMINQDRLNRQAALAEMLQDYATPLHSKVIAALEKDPAAAYGAIVAGLQRRFYRRLSALTKQTPPPTARGLHRSQRRLAMQLLSDVRQARSTVGRGVFDAAMRYELREFHLLTFNVLNPLRIQPTSAASAESQAPPGLEVSLAMTPKEPSAAWQSNTVWGCLANMFVTVPEWLLAGAPPMIARPSDGGWHMALVRSGYLLTMGIFLAICALTIILAGGSICRYTALALAGEDPSMGPCVRFAISRFWFVLRAPLLPLAIVVMVGIVLVAISQLGAIPFIGPILLGIIFFVVLLGSFIIMLVVLGLVGGFNLIFPCLSVEASDGFDAISRSFSYVYNSPWRTAFYVLVSLFYGVITWAFLLLALYVLLSVAHICANIGMSFFGLEHGSYSGLTILNTIWRSPHLERLIAPINWWAMGWSEWIAAMIIYFWLFLLVTLLGAYAVGYYFVSSTIMYLLLRRHVDGQPFSDIAALPMPAALNGPSSAVGPGGTATEGPLPT